MLESAIGPKWTIARNHHLFKIYVMHFDFVGIAATITPNLFY
jgi:hypothetical protein